MAWPTLPTSLNNLSTNWDTSITYLNYTQDAITLALAYFNAGNINMAVSTLINGLQQLHDTNEYMLAYIWTYSPKTNLCAVLKQMRSEYLAGGEDFSMDLLLSTMLQANPKQVQYFVGLVDAYRQSIWNQPFNEEFFAALARGFEQWP